MFNSYKIDIIDQTFEGILGLLFKSYCNGDSFVIFSCYLPPQESAWSDATNFYAHLMTKLHEFNCYDIFICGDFNARIGNLADYIDRVDDLPSRKVIDNEKNSHGNMLIEFLKDTQYCVINGRLTPEKDNFTFVCTRGLSVVDYILTAQSNYSKCISMSVDCTSDILSKLNLFHMLSHMFVNYRIIPYFLYPFA